MEEPTRTDSNFSETRKQRKSHITSPEKETFPTANRTFQNDTLSTEMIYYIGVLQDTLPALSTHADRRRLVPWIKKLFSPELQIDRLRKKRNMYLLHLVLVTFNDKVFGVFKEPPKIGGLPEITGLQSTDPPSTARWETDRYWQTLLHGMVGKECLMACWQHDHCSENEEGGTPHAVAGRLLDEEFKFFLYLVRPLVSLVPDPEEKGTAALWILTLAKVRTTACLTMKAIRNDYMQALLGYLQDLRLAGPFCNKPPENGQTLPPLELLLQTMKKTSPYRSITDPSSEDADLFLSEQPIPESGAFCYIAVTGKAKAPETVSSIPLSTTKYESYFVQGAVASSLWHFTTTSYTTGIVANMNMGSFSFYTCQLPSVIIVPLV